MARTSPFSTHLGMILSALIIFGFTNLSSDIRACFSWPSNEIRCEVFVDTDLAPRDRDFLAELKNVNAEVDSDDFFSLLGLFFSSLSLALSVVAGFVDFGFVVGGGGGLRMLGYLDCAF